MIRNEIKTPKFLAKNAGLSLWRAALDNIVQISTGHDFRRIRPESATTSKVDECPTMTAATKRKKEERALEIKMIRFR